MNADAPAAGEDPILERKKEAFCWPCMFAALLPLLITLFAGWFIAEALTKGRQLSVVEAGAIPGGVEAAEDGQNYLLGLEEDLAASRKALAEAQSKLKSQADASSLQQRIAALPPAERTALLKAAGADLISPAQADAAAAAQAKALTAARADAVAAAEALEEQRAAAAKAKQEAALAAQAADTRQADLEKRLEAEIARRGEADRALAALQAENAEAQQLQKQREQALAQIAKERDEAAKALKAALAEMEDGDARAERLKASLARERKALALAEAKLRNSAASSGDSGTATVKPAELQAARATIEDLEIRLGAETARRETAETALTDLQNELDRVNKPRQKMAADLAQLKKERDAAAKALKAALAEVEDGDARADRLKASLDQERVALEKLRAKIPAASGGAGDQAIAGLERKLAAETAKRVTAQAALTKLRDQAAILQKERDAGAEALKAALAEMEDGDERAKRLSAELAAARAAAKAPTGAPTGADATALEGKLRTAQASLAEAQRKLEASEKAKKESEKKRALAQSENKRLSAQFAGNAARIAKAESSLKALRQELDDARKAHQAEVARLKAVQPQKDTVSAGKTTPPRQSALRTARISSLEKELREEREKLKEATGAKSAAFAALARLKASPTLSASQAVLTLPEIGAVSAANAPQAVKALLDKRDAALQGLRARLITAEAPRSHARSAPAAREPRREPLRDGVAAAAVLPRWRAAPLQEVGGVELAVLSDPIAFDSASAGLTKEGRKAVRKLARQLLKSLKKSPRAQWRLVIEGHTDQRPIRTREFASNWDLSGARAAAVAWELQKQGVPAQRLLAVGRAEAAPIDARWTRKAFAANRRIELSLLRRGGLSRADEK